MNRRNFLKASLSGLAAVPAIRLGGLERGVEEKRTRVALLRTQDRADGIKKALRLLEPPPLNGKRAFIKPNFNTADPYPASTHNDTLRTLVQEFKDRGAARITLGERSGPPPTQKVMEEKGIFALSKELGFEVINFEDLAETDWVHFDPPGSHWPEGFLVPRPLVESEYTVSTCCLKTHQYGGVFSMSLKLSVGATPKRLMRLLHSSADQRLMIAEINAAYNPQFILLDGLEAFVDGGPSAGRKAPAEVIVAGSDRIAVDAVGVAVLKELGSNDALMSRKIFEQEQISRAVELGLGVTSPEKIDIVTGDEPSRLYAARLKAILAQG
jgi:uncharacterized protein (DUF362 family)